MKEKVDKVRRIDGTLTSLKSDKGSKEPLMIMISFRPYTLHFMKVVTLFLGYREKSLSITHQSGTCYSHIPGKVEVTSH